MSAFINVKLVTTPPAGAGTGARAAAASEIVNVTLKLLPAAPVAPDPVNGVPVIRNGEHTGARPGKALRHASAKAETAQALVHGDE